jgi:hypothetical protein
MKKWVNIFLKSIVVILEKSPFLISTIMFFSCFIFLLIIGELAMKITGQIELGEIFFWAILICTICFVAPLLLLSIFLISDEMKLPVEIRFKKQKSEGEIFQVNSTRKTLKWLKSRQVVNSKTGEVE